MKPSTFRITITYKLSLLLLFFVLIFYGTIVHVFLHIQKMMSISEQIVSINNVVANHSKILIENLLEMDANAKKYSLLQKDIYREYFETARGNFDASLSTIKHLNSRGYISPAVFSLFLDEYRGHLDHIAEQSTAAPDAITWVDETTVNTWLSLLVQLRDSNQEQIDSSLVAIHERTLEATRNGLLGFSVSVLAAIFSVWFFSKSILVPLKQLTHGLRTLSRGNYSNQIKVSSKDEFHDLAVAYNEMNSELREQESLRADFIATLSHEIRTPLSSIQESVNMLNEEVLGEVNEKQKKFLTIAEAELSRITGLLNHLLDVSRLDAQQKNDQGEVLDPVSLIRHSIDTLATVAASKDIVIREHFQDFPDAIFGCAKELQQVFINIIGNALKFSPPDSEISISVLKGSNSGYVEIKVTDHGPGIPESELGLIFHKYYRSKAVRKHMDGVGLGLYISKKLIQEMRGSITVENNVDKGCTFSIQLPSVSKLSETEHGSIGYY